MALWFEQRGEGPTVVFLHAGIADARMWQPQWDAYDPPFRLVRLDYPGFGRTPIEAGETVVAGQIAELLDTLEIRGAALVGCSFGGKLALELAVARPELVRALVLVGASMPGLEPSAEMEAAYVAEEEALRRSELDTAVELTMRLWVDGHGRTAADVDVAVRAAVAAQYRHALELQLPFLDSADFAQLVGDLDARLGEVRQPVLLVAGSGDVAQIVRSQALLEAALPGARAATIAGAAHLPSLEQPAAFDALALPFLAETA